MTGSGFVGKCICVLILFGFSSKSIAQIRRYEFNEIKMGTPFNIIVYGEDSMQIKLAVKQAWERIDSINAIFSDYSSTSELSRIHQFSRNQYFKVSVEFSYILDISLRYSKLSKGKFDISIGALTRMWRRAVKLNSFPETGKIEQALQVSGYKKIRFTGSSVRLPEGLLFDFGAIAKGYAVDEAYRILSESQLKMALVDGGGDIYIGDPPPDKAGWSVTSQFRDLNGNVLDSILILHNTSIVTSGDAYKYIEANNKRYSHIIDPISGLGIPGPHWTTVIAGNALHADALATTLSLLPIKQIQKFRKKWKRKFPEQDHNWEYYTYRPPQP